MKEVTQSSLLIAKSLKVYDILHFQGTSNLSVFVVLFLNL